MSVVSSTHTSTRRNWRKSRRPQPTATSRPSCTRAPLTPFGFAAFGRRLQLTYQCRSRVRRPVYERELESPIKNALFGDLLSLLLIQVHKAKVDVARAMLALDKLMRANGANHTRTRTHTRTALVLCSSSEVAVVSCRAQFSAVRGHARHSVGRRPEPIPLPPHHPNR
jgi:hypothetical protein